MVMFLRELLRLCEIILIRIDIFKNKKENELFYRNNWLFIFIVFKFIFYLLEKYY